MNLSSFDLNLLRVLDALLRENSTVRAGARIGLSQPAVSAALGRLRNALGDPLFIRQGQRLVPTDFAASLALPLRRTLEDIEETLAGPGAFHPASSTATFRISGTDFFAELLMPKIAQRIASEAPGVKVQLVDLVRDNYVETIEKYLVDFALLPRMEFPEWIDAKPVFHSSFAVIARKGHPRLARAAVAPGSTVPIDLFCDLGHVLMSPEGKMKSLGDAALAKIGRQRRVVMTVPFFNGVYRTVADSDLVALIPRQLALKVADAVGLDLYLPPVPIEPALLYMVWHKRSSGNAAHRWLRNTASDILTELNVGERPLPTG